MSCESCGSLNANKLATVCLFTFDIFDIIHPVHHHSLNKCVPTGCCPHIYFTKQQWRRRSHRPATFLSSLYSHRYHRLLPPPTTLIYDEVSLLMVESRQHKILNDMLSIVRDRLLLVLFVGNFCVNFGVDSDSETDWFGGDWWAKKSSGLVVGRSLSSQLPRSTIRNECPPNLYCIRIIRMIIYVSCMENTLKSLLGWHG